MSKRLDPGERLLTKVHVELAEGEIEDLGDFEDVLRQRPNSAILWARIPMRFNLMVSASSLERSMQRRVEKGREEGGVRWWLAERMGEPPVVYDRLLTERSRMNVQSLARRKGYLNATCTTLVDSLHPRKAAVEFQLDLGHSWTIGEWNWSLGGSGLEGNAAVLNAKLPLGSKLDIQALDAFREDVAKSLRNVGYPSIQESHIYFVADTSFDPKGHRTRIEAEILPQDWDEFGSPQPHIKARFGSVSWTDGTALDSNSSGLDSSMVSFLISLDSGGPFNERDLQTTYQRLSRLPSVSRVEIPGSLRSTTSSGNVYDVEINIHLRKRFGLVTAMEMIRSDARYGPVVSFAWRDHNFSGKGNTWGAKVSGGLISTRPFSYSNESLVPNSGTWSVDLDYSTMGIPPLDLKRLRPSNQARTTIAANWVREIRPEYVREAVGFRYGFNFIENPAKKSQLEIVPFEFRFSDIQSKPEFEDWLVDQDNPFLSARFADYASLLSRLHWESDWGKETWALTGRYRMDFEWTGMGLSLLNQALEGGAENPGTMTFAGVPLAHYIRLETEWAGQVRVNRPSQVGWHYRLKLGAAKTGSNMDAMPFDRAFYAGGTNGIRGWSVRNLGPGFSTDEIPGSGVVNGVGDLQIEFSMEYRRHLTEALELAWFVDAGNVWLFANSNSNSSALQELNWNSVALGSGLGIRVDFDFFLLRIDGALRVHDPSVNVSERWMDMSAPKGQVHLGIGHSF